MGHHPPPALTTIRRCRTFAMSTFIETKLFSRLIVDYMTDDDYAALQRGTGWLALDSSAPRSSRGCAS